MSRYCRAYTARELAAFPGWRAELEPDEIVFLQDDQTVTRGIHPDEDQLFVEVDGAWRTYCEQVLGFEVPQLEGGPG